MIQEGDRVRHPKQESWGVGKVIEVTAAGRARIFFERAGEKTLLVDRIHLVPVSGIAAESNVLDDVAIARSRASCVFRSLPEMKAVFLRRYPQGFSDARFVADERRPVGEAADRIHHDLGREALRLLLADGRHDEIARRAIDLLAATSLVTASERDGLTEGLHAPESRRIFALEIEALLEGRGAYGARFARFMRCLFALGAARWTIATYFPALSQPAKHFFVKPQTLRQAADACHVDIGYRAEPNWESYQTMLGFARWLLRELKPAGARDLLDVQAFLATVTGER